MRRLTWLLSCVLPSHVFVSFLSPRPLPFSVFHAHKIADMIRYSVNAYTKPVPAILEIPSKDMPYDPNKDSVLARVKHMFSSETK